MTEDQAYAAIAQRMEMIKQLAKECEEIAEDNNISFRVFDSLDLELMRGPSDWEASEVCW